MWRVFLVFLVLSGAAEAKNVWNEVNEWKRGDAIPIELTTTPKCRGDDCGMEPNLALHSISETRNFPLLNELLLEKEATSLVFTVALGRLLESKGFRHVRSLLLNNPEQRAEHTILGRLFRQPIVRVHVAAISDASMPREKASIVLVRLKNLLENGAEWKSAYRTVADENPDKNAGWEGPTLVSLMFSGWLTSQRIEVESQYEATIIPLSHMESVFNLRSGILILKGHDGLYLYWVVEYYAPEI